MEKEKINQHNASYYPPELDENLHQVSIQNSSENKKQQNLAEKPLQNGQKTAKTANFDSLEKLSKLLGGEQNSELLSAIMSMKNQNFSEILSALSKRQNKKSEQTPPQKPTIEEL